MKELTDKICFFEQLFTKFAVDKKEMAYDQFNRQHGYDPRKSHDTIGFYKWNIDGDVINLYYREHTQHDDPYQVVLTFSIADLKMSYAKR